MTRQQLKVLVILLGATAALLGIPLRSHAQSRGAQQPCVTDPLAPSARTTRRGGIPSGIGPRDTVVRAGERYAASDMHRWLYGDDYRDLWTAPIHVPFLDLHAFAGGIKPTKTGGGKQTKNLHFESASGDEFVFRPVFKRLLVLPLQYRHTTVKQIFDDQLAASHPAATVMVPPFLDAVGVLHPHPVLVEMPNDPALGKFRADFAGSLGTIEEFPAVPDHGPGFAGATKIIASDKLLERLNRNPDERVDARKFLTARLVDLLIGDNDRHPGQWKWARLSSDKHAPWEPIPVDRDKAFVSYEGSALSLARYAEPTLVTFDKRYPDLNGLFYNAIEFDRRLLVGLDKSVWDSVARFVSTSISDSVIRAAMMAAPRAYQTASAELTAKLRARRNGLPAEADRYYEHLFAVADVQSTDANDRVTVEHAGNGLLSVKIAFGNKPPWFSRRFSDADTKEIRIYLHGGNDTAIVRGVAQASPVVRIIGGNGRNLIVDSSTVGGERKTSIDYDRGNVRRWSYTPDTVNGEVYAPDTAWDRRPWWKILGQRTVPLPDRGTTMAPIVGLRTGSGLGFAPTIGLSRITHGFRDDPYASRVALMGTWSTSVAGGKLEATTDNRFQGSPWHITSDEFASRLELVQFHGFGNDQPRSIDPFYDLRQTQYVVHPALGLAFGPRSDVSIGPIVKYVTTDSTPGRYVTEHQPYGFGRFGQAGIEADLRYDTRDHVTFPGHGVLAVASASAYPAQFGAAATGGAFEEVSAVATTFWRLPLPRQPVLAVRTGGKKLFGDFPFYEAAFIGGSNTVRTYDYRQYAGDASLYGSTELRVPLVNFDLVLPLNLGAIGFYDAGRVFDNGSSPAGWHTAAGGGFWLGAISPGTSVRVLFSNRAQNRISLGIGFNY